MNSATAADRKPWFKKWWVWVIGVVALLVIISAIGNIGRTGDDPQTAAESTPTQEAPATLEPTAETPAVVTEPTAEDTTEPTGPSDEERNTVAFDALRSTFGGEEPSAVFASDSSLWYGWISGTRVEGSNFYVTLQVDSGDSERMPLGERAAKAIPNLLTGDAVDGLSWVIVEDASNVVIDQTMFTS